MSTASASEREGFALRVSIGFGGVFLPLAVQLAFIPVWFEHVGFTPSEIGVLLGIPIAVRVVTTPPLVALADRVADRRKLFVLFALIALAASLGLLVTTAFLAVLVISIAISVATAVAIPLSDAIALSGVRRLGLDYGVMRLWGSVAFIVGTVVAGWWLGVGGAGTVPLALSLALLTTVVAGIALPSSVARRERQERSGGPLWRDRTLTLGCAAAALTIASQAMFYGFGSIHWASLGFAGITIGALWAVGVVSEIALFALAPRLLPNVTPLGLIVAGSAIGAIRWAMWPVGEGVAFFAANSVLHAGSFGAAHLGLQRLIGARVTDERQGAAQGLAFAMSGPAMALATFASGPLYGAFGASAFVAMAALCVVGAVCALLALHPHSKGDGGETIEPE